MGNLTCTASGSVANFYTPYAVPIRSFNVHFSPKQSGSGDPSPTNVRPIEGWTGVTGYRDKKSVVWNQMVEGCLTSADWQDRNSSETNTIFADGVATIDFYNSPGSYHTLLAKEVSSIKVTTHKYYGRYEVNANKDGLAFGIEYINSIQQYSIVTNYTANTWRHVSTIRDGLYDRNRTFYMPFILSGTMQEGVIAQVRNPFCIDLTLMFGEGNEPETPEEFEAQCALNGIDLSSPYHLDVAGTVMGWKTADTDEIPISFPAVGKNLFDESSVIYGAWTDTNGNISTSARGCISDKIPINNNSSLLLVHLGESPYSYSIIEYDSEGEFIARYHNNGNGSNVQPVVVSSLNSNTRCVSIQVTSSYSSAAPTITPEVLSSFKMMLVYGNDIPTEYEVYKGNTYFGGYVDLVSGELVQTHVVYNGGWVNYNSNNGFKRYQLTGLLPPDTSDRENMSNITSLFSVISSNTTDNRIQPAAQGSTSINAYLCLDENVSADNVQYGYKLATPITHTLSPQTLSTLVHSNAFWSNADSVEIEYDLAECGDIKEIRRRILLNTPHLETASGSVAHFSTDMAAKLKECKVNFLPQQAGTGDASPDNVRAISGWTGCDVVRSGKNVVEVIGYSAQSVTSKTGTRSLTNPYGTTISITDFSQPDTPLVITQSQWPNEINYHYRNGYFYIVVDNLVFEKRYNVSFRVTNITNNPLNTDISKIRLLSPRGDGNLCVAIGDRLCFNNVTFFQNTSAPNRSVFEIRVCGMSFTLSEFMVTPVEDEDYTYAPYDPDKITVSFPCLGKNLARVVRYSANSMNSPTDAGILSNSYGTTISTRDFVLPDTPLVVTQSQIDSTTATPSSYKNGYFTVNPDNLVFDNNRQYTVSFRVSNVTNNLLNADLSNIKISNPNGSTYISSVDGDRLIFTGYKHVINPNRPNHHSITIYVCGMSFTLSEFMVTPVEDKDYTFEPYTNTIYGGYIDVLRGELVQEWAKVQLKDISFVYNSTYKRFTGGNSIFAGNATRRSLLMCDSYVTGEGTGSETPHLNDDNMVYFYSNAAGTNINLHVKDSRYTEPSDLIANMGETTVVYKLATPITYPLSPEIIKAIKGVNNVWSDAGDVEVKYWTH